MVQKVDALLDRMASFDQWPILGASHAGLAGSQNLLVQEIRLSRLVEWLPGNYPLPTFGLSLLPVCCRLSFFCCNRDLSIVHGVLFGFVHPKRPLV